MGAGDAGEGGGGGAAPAFGVPVLVARGVVSDGTLPRGVWPTTLPRGDSTLVAGVMLLSSSSMLKPKTDFSRCTKDNRKGN